MASLHRHGARARSCLPSTSTASFPVRSRSLHTTRSLGADGTNDESSNTPTGTKPRAPLRGVALNRAAFNAIKSQGSSGSSSSTSSDSVRNTVNQFVGRDARHLASSSPPTGARPLRARRTGFSQTSRGQASRPPGRSSGDGFGGDEVAAPRRTSFGGARGGRGGRMAGRGRGRGGIGGGGGRRGRRSLYQEDDDLADLDVGEGGSAEIELKEDVGKPILTPALKDLLSDLSNPAELLSDLDNLNLTDKERRHVLNRVADSRRPDPYAPKFDLNDLVGLSPRIPAGSADDPLAAADTLHQALSDAAPLEGIGADLNTPASVADGFRRGGTAFLRDQTAQQSFEAILGADKGTGGKEGTADEDNKFNTPSAEVRAKVNEYVVAGKYAPPGSLAPKNADDRLKDVYKILARNGSFIEPDEKSLASKIASMLPAARPAPAPAAGGKSQPAATGKKGTKAKEAVKA